MLGKIPMSYIKLVGELIVALMILYVVLAPEGIVANTALYLAYAEPVLVQQFVSSTATIAGWAPGDFFASMKTTGHTHQIVISSDSAGHRLVSVKPETETMLHTKWEPQAPTAFMTGGCSIPDGTITLKTGLEQTVTVKKTIASSGCSLAIEVH